MCCAVCAVSLATWLLFTAFPVWSAVRAVFWATWPLLACVAVRSVELRVRCARPLGSCSPVCCVCGVIGPFARGCARAVCCVCRFLGNLVPVHQCAPAVCCVRRVLGCLALVHRCARSVCSIACTVSSATGLLFTAVPARCVVLRVRCPWPLGSCSLVCTLRVLCVRCPSPLGSYSAVCPFAVWCCVYGDSGVLALAHGCAACARSLTTWLLLTGVPTGCVVLCIWGPWPFGLSFPVCQLGLLCPAFGVLRHFAPVHRCARFVCSVRIVLGHLAPVHRCARSVCCVACAVSSATWLLFTGVPARCAVLCVRCPWPLGSCPPVCPLGVRSARCPWPLESC